MTTAAAATEIVEDLDPERFGKLRVGDLTYIYSRSDARTVRYREVSDGKTTGRWMVFDALKEVDGDAYLAWPPVAANFMPNDAAGRVR